MYADQKDFKIYVYFEYGRSMMSLQEIADMLIENGFGDTLIYADSAEPRTIKELQTKGVYGIRGVRKETVISGIRKLQDYEIIVSPRCPHTIESLCNYAWKKDRMTGAILEEPEHEFSHFPDSIRYGTSELSKWGIQV